MKITGTDALQKRLKRLATLADVQNVIKKHGTQMQQGAMRKAPVDTGFLKRSITLSIEDGGLTARVGSNAEHAMYIEYGTGIYASNGKGRKTPWFYYNAKLGHVVQTSGMMAKPFMRPSFYEQRNKFASDLKKIMK